MTTEIQRIPGNFNLPASWPKIYFPDIKTNVLYDWHADDLSVGAFQPWVDRISGMRLETSAAEFDLPMVVLEDNGHKAVVFDKRSKLKASTGLLPNLMTMSIVAEAGLDNSASSRLISGSSGFKLVNMDTSSGKMTVNSTMQNADQSRTTLGSAIIPGLVTNKKTNAIVRYEPGVSITGQLLGGNAVSGTLGPEVSNTTVLMVGYNTSPVPTSSLVEGFRGKVSRITIWKKALTTVDMQAVFMENKLSYKLPD